MKTKALFIALIAALVLICVSCEEKGSGNGIYGVSTKGEASTELIGLADEMHHAVQAAVGTIILYFAPSTVLGQPDSEKVTIKSWTF